MSTVVAPVTHPVRLTERINRIEPSATMAVVAEADKLRQQGIDVVDFGAGEPHFSTPQHIKDAAIAAIQSNFSKYTPVGGTAELKDAIVHRHAVDFDSDYRREEAVASVGGKHALFNVISVLVDHGDEVILPVPYWVSFKDMVRYAGGKCVLLQSDESQGFRVTADMVAELVTPKTKLIILNSPSNPSGAVISPEDMTEVVRLAHQRGIWVISDECYVYLTYTGKRFSVGSLREYRDRFMVVGSLSKTYAMTGWRLGFTLGPAPIVTAVQKLQSQSTSNPTSIVQKAAILAAVDSHRRGADHFASSGALLDRGEAALEMQRARASIIVETIRRVGLLLRLHDDGARPQCMHRAASNVNHFALVDIDPVEQFLSALFMDALLEIRARDAGFQSKRDLRPGLGVRHVPAFSFAPRPAKALSRRVVRMNLYRKFLLGKQKLEQ